MNLFSIWPTITEWLYCPPGLQNQRTRAKVEVHVNGVYQKGYSRMRNMTFYSLIIGSEIIGFSQKGSLICAALHDSAVWVCQKGLRGSNDFPVAHFLPLALLALELKLEAIDV